MAVNFPDSPTNGQEVTVGTTTYSYNSSKGVWVDTASTVTTQLSKYLEVANSSNFASTSSLNNYLQVANVASSITVPTRGSTVSVGVSNRTLTVVGRSANTSVGVT